MPAAGPETLIPAATPELWRCDAIRCVPICHELDLVIAVLDQGDARVGDRGADILAVSLLGGSNSTSAVAPSTPALLARLNAAVTKMR